MPLLRSAQTDFKKSFQHLSNTFYSLRALHLVPLSVNLNAVAFHNFFFFQNHIHSLSLVECAVCSVQCAPLLLSTTIEFCNGIMVLIWVRFVHFKWIFIWIIFWIELCFLFFFLNFKCQFSILALFIIMNKFWVDQPICWIYMHFYPDEMVISFLTISNDHHGQWRWRCWFVDSMHRINNKTFTYMIK